MQINRRQFGKRVAAGVAGFLAFLAKPVSAKPDGISLKELNKIRDGINEHTLGEFGTIHGVRWIQTKPNQRAFRWRRWARIETPTMPLTDGIAPFNPYLECKYD